MSAFFINIMYKELQQYIPTPIRKCKLLSFHKYYCRTLSNSPSRSLSEQRPSFIDGAFIQKIDSIVPRKIHRHISRQSNKVQKFRTEQSTTISNHLPQFEQIYQKLRRKSLRKAELDVKLQIKVMKKTLGKKKNVEANFFKYQEMPWVQKKWGFSEKKGKYSQKLHPMCNIYEQFAERVISNRLHPPNPFEGYNPMEL